MRTAIILTLAIFFSCNDPSETRVEERKAEAYNAIPNLIDSAQFQKARQFCRGMSYNTQVAFFLDMSIRSGRKRFFVVDLVGDSVQDAGLVTHGHCKNYAARKPGFSNEPGSNCTSLGKYKVGGKYSGRFGTAYKLHGLEATNSNAFDRFVVLHAHGCVPNFENSFGICRSEGCPTVSPKFLAKLEKVIDGSNKPVLMWIYDGDN